MTTFKQGIREILKKLILPADMYYKIEEARELAIYTTNKEIISLLSTTIEGCIPGEIIKQLKKEVLTEFKQKYPLGGEVWVLQRHQQEMKHFILRVIDKSIDTITDNLRKAGVI